MPALLHALLDEGASKEALRVLGIVLTDDIFHLNAATAVAVPCLIRLATDHSVPHRAGLLGLLAVAAELSQPVDGENGQWSTILFGTDDDHPERAACRAAFADHANAVHMLLADRTLSDRFLTSDDRNSLLRPISTS